MRKTRSSIVREYFRDHALGDGWSLLSRTRAASELATLHSVCSSVVLDFWALPCHLQDTLKSAQTKYGVLVHVKVPRDPARTRHPNPPFVSVLQRGQRIGRYMYGLCLRHDKQATHYLE
jgi:hypothetical protein